MSTLRILGRTTSINVRKVLWTAAELNIPIRHEDEWGTPARMTSLPEFKTLNPNALIPVIEDENGVLWELNTICRYLANKHAPTKLLPSAPMARAEVEKWMDWQATELNTAWRYAFMALVRQDLKFADANEIQRSVASWNRLMGLLDQQLSAQRLFITGAEFSLADIALGLSAHRWDLSPIERPDLPNVRTWLGRLRSRKAATAYLAQDLP